MALDHLDISEDDLSKLILAYKEGRLYESPVSIGNAVWYNQGNSVYRGTVTGIGVLVNDGLELRIFPTVNKLYANKEDAENHTVRRVKRCKTMGYFC